MAWNRCAHEGSFSVEMRRCACPPEGRALLQREIATTFEEKNRLLEEVTGMVGRLFVADETELFRVRLSIDEGLQNAFSHGNKQDPQKKIRVSLFETDACWGITIQDEGPGFDPENLRDPTSPEGLWLEHGRGLMIMCHYMDEVSYFEDGRTLRLLRRKEDGRTAGHAASADPDQRQE
jgi:serine/threonine-protein kinase RsbW